MTTTIVEREEIFQAIQNLPDDKAAKAMSYIKALGLDEPPLTQDEIEGLRIANLELSNGEGRSFKEALKDLW
jgi:hypothetical protein